MPFPRPSSRRPSWPAVRAVAHHELRRRWGSVLVLGLLAALVAGVATGGAAVARRTATASDRLAVAAGVEDVRVAAFGTHEELGDVPARVAALPQARDSWTGSVLVAQVRGEHVRYVSVLAGPPAARDPAAGVVPVFRPVVVDGRAPDPGDPTQVAVSEDLARSGLGVGSRLHLDLLTPEEVGDFDVGFGQPDGPVVEVTVTGVLRRPEWGQGVGPVVASEAFARAYGGYASGAVVMLRLDRADDDLLGPVAASTRADVEESLAGVLAALPVPEGAEQLGPAQVVWPTGTPDPAVEVARRVLVGGVLATVGVVVLAGGAALLLGFARQHSLSAAAVEVQRALGMTSSEQVLARVLASIPAAALAALGALVGGLAVARTEPLGSLRTVEPAPGTLLAGGVMAAGAALAAAATLLLSAATAARTARTAGTAGAGSAVPGGGRSRRRPVTRPAVGRVLLPAPLAAGLVLAVRPTRRRGGAPARSTLLGASLGLAGTVAVLTVGAGVARLDQPARYGWTSDAIVVDVKDDELDVLVEDPRVAAVTVVEELAVLVDGQPATAVALRPVAGRLPWTVVSGRLPAAPDEIAVGVRTARHGGLRQGSTVDVVAQAAGPDQEGASRRLSVVGTVTVPSLSGEDLGTGAVVPVATLHRLAGPAGTAPWHNAAVLAEPGQAGDLTADLARRVELALPEPPPEVRNVVALGALPTVLLAFLVLLVATVLSHALVSTVRRRRHDLSVLLALGFTPVQVGATVVGAAVCTVGSALLVGLPVGLLLGRAVWAEIAVGIGVAPVLAVPWTGLAVLVPAALVAAVTVAALPARAASRLRPGTVLAGD